MPVGSVIVRITDRLKFQNLVVCAFLLAMIPGCASSPVAGGRRVELVAEEDLVEPHAIPAPLGICVLGRRDDAVCYTSQEALRERSPLAVLHRRFLQSRKTLSISATDEQSLDGASLCTVGFMWSCELDQVLREEGYTDADRLAVIQLHEILSRSVSPYILRRATRETFFPDDYDPTSFEQFETAVRRAINWMKANDSYWRRDW